MREGFVALTPHWSPPPLTECVWMFDVCLTSRRSWVCQKPCSLGNTRTDRSPQCWCIFRFYTATSGCSALSTRSHLQTARHSWYKAEQHRGCVYIMMSSPTDADHTGQVECVSFKAFASVTLLNPDTPAILTSVKNPAFLCLQALKCTVTICSTKTPETH